jgi:hypothetical protein
VPSTLREVLLEDLIAHPLRRRPLAAPDLQTAGAVSPLDVDAPVAGLAVSGNRQDHAEDPELLERGVRDAFHVLLFQRSPGLPVMRKKMEEIRAFSVTRSGAVNCGDARRANC